VFAEPVPRMSRTSFYLPDELKARAQREAERMGIDFSEYVRQSIVLNCAWADVIRLVRAGVDPATLETNEDIVALLTGIVSSLQNDAEPPQ
jgi:antitoxin component of RelBE/YafQ-DinJ toxin-antitoxin module